MPAFVFANLINVLQRQADVVQAIEQIFFAEGVNVKVEAVAAGCGDLLVGEIDVELYALTRGDFRHELIQHLGADFNR